MTDFLRQLREPSPIERELSSMFDFDDRLVLFNIGGGEGEDSVKYALMFPKSQIYSFESRPGKIEKLKANVAKYHQSSVTIVPSIDDLPGFCRAKRIGQIDFIHIDVPGGKKLILLAVDNFLKKVKAVWLKAAAGQEAEIFMTARGFVKVIDTATTPSFARAPGDQLYLNRRYFPKLNLSTPLKILHTVESYAPSTGGMQEVVRQLSERLVKAGHQVTIATSKHPKRRFRELNGVELMTFPIGGNLVRGYSGNTKAYQQFLLKSKFDVIVNFAAQQWATDLALPLLDRIKAKKVFVPTGFSGFYFPEYQGYFQSMADWMRQYDMNVFLSNNYRDINFARQHGVQRISVIPNGAAADEFLHTPGVAIRRKLGIPGKDFLILLVGSHTGVKGHNEAFEIFAQAQISHATLLIVANSFGGGCTRQCSIKRFVYNHSFDIRSRYKKIIIPNLTRSETVAAYHEADLFLFTSNIECSPIVLFESMASKTPFLTTDVGNAAEIISWTRGGRLLPTKFLGSGYSRADIKRSAHYLEEMFSNPKERQLIAQRGYQAWLNRFTWEKIAEDYETLYRRLVRVWR